MATETSAFRIYDASAGSGKTYTLTLEYLKLLLKPGGRRSFRHMLAITFTNKAVAELKQRILSSLRTFSELPEDAELPSLFAKLQEALGMEAPALKARCAEVLKEILHNYAFFDISTIDRFNHRILRTFAQDLRLPAHFEAEIDTDSLLSQAVEALIRKTGDDPELTGALIDFALEKSAEDRHWDIAFDLRETGSLLFNENNFRYLDALAGKGIRDYAALRKSLEEKRKGYEESILEIAREMAALLDRHQLGEKDFYRGFFPKFLEKILSGHFEMPNRPLKWQEEFADRPLYPSNLDAGRKTLMDGLHVELAQGLSHILETLSKCAFLSNVSSNMAPFTVLGLLQAELKRIQEEESLLPVARFNAIIAAEIAGQPAPYIYERLGEKFRHYFIDEFQDTSELQWKNLIPLIGNALESLDEQGRQGSLILVGDAKQAIYRWRGGKAEQFLDLSNHREQPFSVPAEHIPLPRNFRSRQTIVDFNNAFFLHHSKHLANEAYQKLFEKGGEQKPESQEAGLVHLEFLEADVADLRAAYTEKAVTQVVELLGSGYSPAAICILTRKGDEGIAVSEGLVRAGIPIMSSETLLLKNHPGVGFLTDLLRYLHESGDKNHQYAMLRFLYGGREDFHTATTEALVRFQAFVEEFGFPVEPARTWAVYDILEEAIRAFGLCGEGDGYLLYLLDLAHEVGQRHDPSIARFLEYWETHEDKLSVAAPEGQQAVRLMTIHKAKGLEFPVVIYPFADTQIYFEQRPKVWLEVPAPEFAGFPYLQLSKRQEMERYGPEAREAYLQERERLELDAFNVLYVAQTRAAEALYVFTRQRSRSASSPMSDYGSLYQSYLEAAGLWEAGRQVYTFGQLQPGPRPTVTMGRETLSLTPGPPGRKRLNLVTRAASLWETEAGSAISYGNLIHLALSRVTVYQDVPGVVAQLVEEGMLELTELEPVTTILKRVTEHPDLKSYFGPMATCYAERDIIAENGLILRPDRLVLIQGEAVVLDYKTGGPRPEHREQLARYVREVSQLGLGRASGILIYIDPTGVNLDYL
ncbi:UvrD-helicase domain-containing protein [Robiginitalea sediminis]|uniref:UvrD-helicase domain-containing protein n=1 Tax=Robiginitalea sediminis TaxID=1982593 RepID=UPI000B4B1512|nr:UvrD-helicase domain-containing protein [Robiginitalea sediminis]